MDKTRREYTEANRLAWDEVAPRHAELNNEALFAGFTDPGFVTFDTDMRRLLAEVGVEGKQVVQLCCNNGRETLSLYNLGAAYCLGIDASQAFLEHGREMIRIAGAGERVELLQSDVYDLPPELNNRFDLVLVTVGVIYWLPDLPGFLRVVRGLLRPGGKLVMQEMHPVLLTYEEDPGGGPSQPAYSYFSGEVWKETGGLDYYGRAPFGKRPSYSFMHRLDELLTAALDAGLELRRFRELGIDISNFCSDLENSPVKPPLGLLLVMQLPQSG